MPFVEIARQFLNDQGDLANHKYHDEMVSTVEYLLENAVGLDNAVRTDTIIDHLKEECGYKINREEWQIKVLGTLRNEGIYIASHKSKGMFIISDENDARIVTQLMKNRIGTESDRLSFLVSLCRLNGWDISV